MDFPPNPQKPPHYRNPDLQGLQPLGPEKSARSRLGPVELTSGRPKNFASIQALEGAALRKPQKPYITAGVGDLPH